MAKKKTATKRTGPWAGVALYNLAAETEKGARVRAALECAGVPVRTIHPDRLGDPVGAFAGLMGFKRATKPFDGEAPDFEFMLVCGLPNAQLNAVLATLREADAQVERKATVTQYNRMWPLATLMSEIAREHEAMTAAAQAQGQS